MVVVGAIGAMMTEMTVIGPRAVIALMTTAIGRVAYAMTCQLRDPMTKTALLATTSEARTAHRRD
jgi:hypothetical protein